MPDPRPSPVVRLQHRRNRTPTGKRTATPARQAAAYFAFGRQANQSDRKQRGEWLGPGGVPYAHEAVLAWVQRQARQYEHTFQALLSVPQARLTGADYARALEAAGSLAEWRLVAHNDTHYSHAHVLFFRDQRLDKAQFSAWQRQVRQALAVLEEKRLAAPEQALAPAAAPELAAAGELAAAATLCEEARMGHSLAWD